MWIFVLLLAVCHAEICPDVRARNYFTIPGKVHTPGMTPGSTLGVPNKMSVCELYELHQYCVDKINWYRTARPTFTDGRSPTFTPVGALQMLDKPFLQCHNEKAMSDLAYDKAGNGCGHFTAGATCKFASTSLQSGGTENSCCKRGCTTLASCKSTLDGCLRQMYDEGELVLDGVTNFQQIGHYLNMVGSSTHATCGFGFDDSDSVYMTQNFYSNSVTSLCAYNCGTSTSVANECQSPYAKCYGVSYCASNSDCVTPPVCYSSAGVCSAGRCSYTTPVATCPAGTCVNNQCVQQCFDPNCGHCVHSGQGGCDMCTNGKLEAGCCVTDCVVLTDASYGGTYLAAGFSASGHISYYNSANGRYLAFYCCNWGWSITTAVNGGSVYKHSDFTAGDALASSGKWAGSSGTTVTKCYAACIPLPACNTPPECYQLPGSCGACGCTYTPKANGATCTGGTCQAGICVAGAQTCPTLNPPTGSSSAACTGITVGGQCTFTCSTGYIQNGGTATRTCNTGPTWSGTALVCSQTCPTLSSPANAVAATCANRLPGTSCTFTCNNGFVDNGQLTRNCVAGSPPTWSGSAATCTAIPTCPSLVPPTNGEGVACTGVTTGTCTFSCATGFQQRLGTDLTRTCSNGAWGGTALVCDPIPCPTLSSPAQATAATCQNKVHGDTCQFACVYGASATAGTTIRTCNAGSWTPTTALVCSWTVCPTLSSPQNAVAKSCTNQIHGSTCAFNCNAGFAPSGQTYTCDNGAWTPASSLVCTALVCPDLASPTGANTASCNGRTEGFVCTFSCSGTNVASGSTSRTCTNGAWTGTPLSCSAPAQCPSLTAPTYSSSATCTGYISGQVCDHTCNVGYTQTGGPRTCSPPNWSGTPVTCTPKSCPTLYGPPNTVPTPCSGKVEDDTCTFVCDVGFTGSFTKTCKNGNWTGLDLFCSPKICPTLGAPLNSNSATCANKVQLETCVMTCNTGFTPKTSTRTCSDGAWTGTNLICTALVCPDLVAPASATGASCLQKTQGEVCTFACQATYTSNGQESRTCNDGAWTGSALTCTAPNSCPALNSPVGAVAQVCTGKTAGQTCTFACATGYTAGTGDATRVCGEDGQWAGVALQCNPKPCPSISSPSGALTATCANRVHGGVCTFQCLSGYSSNGFESRTCTDGAWTGSPLVCAPMPCPDLVAPSGAAVATCLGKVEGETCTFACDAASTTTVGDPTRICRSGTWTGQQLQCPLNTVRFAYSASDWSMCPVTCGSAFQTRTVNCLDTLNGNVITNFSNCKDLHAIDAIQSCPIPATVCPVYTWSTEPYGPCSKVCGTGESTRSVTCTVTYDGVPGGPVPNERCMSEGLPPASSMMCNTDPCVAGTHNWVTLPFSECSTTCGPGTQTRTVQCQDSMGNVVLDTECTATKPPISMDCSAGACKSYSWRVCNWTDCTASCDTSMQSEQHRDVWCSAEDPLSGATQVTDDSFCLALSPKPNGLLTGCNIIPCTTFNWMVSPWSACINGRKTRNAHCHAADTRVALNSECPQDKQPALSMPCVPFQCDTEPGMIVSSAPILGISVVSYLILLCIDL